MSAAIVAAGVVRGIISLTWLALEFLERLPTGTSVEVVVLVDVDPRELDSAGSIALRRTGKLGTPVAA